MSSRAIVIVVGGVLTVDSDKTQDRGDAATMGFEALCGEDQS